jgi:hypothetical protein
MSFSWTDPRWNLPQTEQVGAKREAPESIREIERLLETETRRAQSGIDKGDPRLDRLMRSDQQRLFALASGNHALAAIHLQSVATDLKAILDAAVTLLAQNGAHKRHAAKRTTKQDLAAATAAALPLGEIADLLGLPRKRVDATLRLLAEQGNIPLARREEVLRGVNELRSQIGSAAARRDHLLMDRLKAVILRIFAALMIGGAVETVCAVTMGEANLPASVMQAGITALVTQAFKEAATAVGRHGTLVPLDAVRATLKDLIDELALVGATSGDREPASAGSVGGPDRPDGEDVQGAAFSNRLQVDVPADVLGNPRGIRRVPARST